MILNVNLPFISTMAFAGNRDDSGMEQDMIVENVAYTVRGRRADGIRALVTEAA